MKNEERKLVLKVLCEQLPYGVKVHYNLERSGESGIFSFDRKHKDIGVLYYEDYSEEEKRDCNYDKEHFSILLCGCYYGEDIKPYLRPMSSMTKEEAEEFYKVTGDIFKFYPGCKIYDYIPAFDNNCTSFDTFDDEYEYKRVKPENVIACIDFLNIHHFDYHGLIEKGLALEAPEGMYKFE